MTARGPEEKSEDRLRSRIFHSGPSDTRALCRLIWLFWRPASMPSAVIYRALFWWPW